MSLTLVGGLAATALLAADARLLVSLGASLLVVAAAMRTRQARQRLAPLLLVVAGLTVAAAAADPGVRAWL